MSHFYSVNADGSATLLKTIDTVAKARKSPNAVASVTTVLGCVRNLFLEIWMLKQAVKLTLKYVFRVASIKELPSITWEQVWEYVEPRLYGTRTCPETGEDISSSDFGTRLHAALEKYNLWKLGNEMDIVKECGDYGEWVDLWADWVEGQDIEVVAAELCIGCEKRRVAGTIDFIGTMKGEVILCDYKSRPFVGKKSLPVYDKDKMQLALEAQMIKELWNLDYLPKTYTVLLDTDEPAMKVKQHTEKAQAKAYGQAMSCVTFFNDYNGL